MNTRTNLLVAPLALSTLLTACAGAPTASTTSAVASSTALSPLDCSALRAEIQRTEAVRGEALQKEHDAWKAVVPFAVAARYASSKSAVGDADQTLAALRTEHDRRNCDNTAR